MSTFLSIHSPILPLYLSIILLCLLCLYFYPKVFPFFDLLLNLNVLKLHKYKSRRGPLLFFLTFSEAFHSEDLNLSSTGKIFLLFLLLFLLHFSVLSFDGCWPSLMIFCVSFILPFIFIFFLFFALFRETPQCSLVAL